MERPSFHDLSTSTYEFNDPSTSSSNHELNPDLIAMDRSHTFSGAINEEPYDHLQEFEDVFILGCPRNDARNLEMEVVSFLSHGESETMVHSFGREHER
jgi:hypothetical protein